MTTSRQIGFDDLRAPVRRRCVFEGGIIKAVVSSGTSCIQTTNLALTIVRGLVLRMLVSDWGMIETVVPF